MPIDVDHAQATGAVYVGAWPRTDGTYAGAVTFPWFDHAPRPVLIGRFATATMATIVTLRHLLVALETKGDSYRICVADPDVAALATVKELFDDEVLRDIQRIARLDGGLRLRVGFGGAPLVVHQLLRLADLAV